MCGLYAPTEGEVWVAGTTVGADVGLENMFASLSSGVSLLQCEPSSCVDLGFSR